MAMVKSSRMVLQAALYSIISLRFTKPVRIGDDYGAYRSICDEINLRVLIQRAFSNMVSVLDMCDFIHARVFSWPIWADQGDGG